MVQQDVGMPLFKPGATWKDNMVRLAYRATPLSATQRQPVCCGLCCAAAGAAGIHSLRIASTSRSPFP